MHHRAWWRIRTAEGMEPTGRGQRRSSTKKEIRAEREREREENRIWTGILIGIFGSWRGSRWIEGPRHSRHSPRYMYTYNTTRGAHVCALLMVCMYNKSNRIFFPNFFPSLNLLPWTLLRVRNFAFTTATRTGARPDWTGVETQRNHIRGVGMENEICDLVHVVHVAWKRCKVLKKERKNERKKEKIKVKVKK